MSNMTLPFFDALSESLTDFVLFLVVFVAQKVARFKRNRFYWKRGCVTMRNYVLTFHESLGYHLG